MKRNGCLGVGELALEGNREETADETTLVAVDSALLAVLPTARRCFAMAACEGGGVMLRCVLCCFSALLQQQWRMISYSIMLV